MPTLYSFGNTANVSSNNFTTLYNSGAGTINPQLAYGNANVESFLAVGTDGSNTIGNITAAGNISTAGNVLANAGVYAANYYYANGAPLNTQGNYSNANVAAYLPTYTGNLAGGNLAITNNTIVSGNITTGQNLTTGGNIQATGNIRTTGASGNITGANYISAQFYLGDGGLLSNIGSTYSNANVSAYLAAGITSNIITTGNVTGNYILGNGSQLTGLPATYSNANVATFLANFGSNVISTTGNISGGNISTTGNVTISGSLNSDDITSAGVTVYGDQVITGNLTVQGTTTTINSNTIVTNDKTITVANNQSTSANVNGAGIEAGNPAVATLLYNALTNSWQSNVGVTPVANLTQELGNNQNRWSTVYAGAVDASGNITAVGFVGNGSQLTSITGANVTGTVANATYATSAGTANTAITVTGNAQANITSVGVLTSLSVSGNTTSGNVLTTSVQATGSGGLALKNSAGTTQASLGGGGGDNFAINVSTNLNGNNAQIDISPIGTGHVHIKPTGTGAVEIAPTNTGSINNMIIGNVTPAAVSATTVSASGNITGAFFLGNGSQLTGLPDTYSNANVTTLLAAFGSNTILTTGNITAGNFIGSGAYLSSLPAANISGTVANAAYASDAAHATVADSANAVAGANVTGTVGLAQYVTQAAQGNITSVGTLTGLTATGNITTTGNITGDYFLGNGSQLTGLPATYGNANVAANLAAFGSNPISTTGNITAGYFVGNGSALTGVTATLPANITGTSLSVTGNVTGAYYFGNGSTLTGITASLPANITGNVFTSVVYSYGNATGTITPDISLGSIQTMTLTGNITLNSLANVNTGQTATFIINQDATGNRLLTSTWKFASNVRTLSTAANAIDMISVSYIGNTYYASLIRGFL